MQLGTKQNPDSQGMPSDQKQGHCQGMSLNFIKQCAAQARWPVGQSVKFTCQHARLPVSLVALGGVRTCPAGDMRGTGITNTIHCQSVAAQRLLCLKTL
jgi:hypothetical protein